MSRSGISGTGRQSCGMVRSVRRPDRPTHPGVEHLAKTIFGLDGVYVDLMTAPFAPPKGPRHIPSTARLRTPVGCRACFSRITIHGDGNGSRNAPIRTSRRRLSSTQLLRQVSEGRRDIYPCMLLEDTSRCPGFGAAAMWYRLGHVQEGLRDRRCFFRNTGRGPGPAQRWGETSNACAMVWLARGQGWYAILQRRKEAWPDFTPIEARARIAGGCSG